MLMTTILAPCEVFLINFKGTLKTRKSKGMLASLRMFPHYLIYNLIIPWVWMPTGSCDTNIASSFSVIMQV